MIRRRSSLILLMLLAPALGAVSKARVDALVTDATRDSERRAVIVGIVDADGRHVFNYGELEAGSARPPDERTVFEIGSVTKVFTAILLAQMVEAKQVRLDEPVKDLLPADVEMQSKDGVEITLLHLTTQRSGLPRMPVNFYPADFLDPYADYRRAMLYEGLAEVELDHKPGEAYEYSNLGVGLLGEALAERGKASYEQLIVERVCRPMGLHETRVTLEGELRQRFAPPHNALGQVVKPWGMAGLGGAGALRSTLADMLTFVSANVGLVKTPLDSALKMTHEVRGVADEDSDIAMGWHVTKKYGVRWHNGGTGGFHSFVAFVPKQRVGVTVWETPKTWCEYSE